MRTVIVIAYVRTRASDASLGAVGRDVTDAAGLERFTMLQAYAAQARAGAPSQGQEAKTNGRVKAPIDTVTMMSTIRPSRENASGM